MNRNDKITSNPWALLPIAVFLVLYLGLGLVFEYVLMIEMGFYKIPIVVVFLVALFNGALLNKEKGITVILITHHMNEAENADHLIVMDDGVVAMEGTPKEVFQKVEELRSIGLTVPDTVDLLDRLQKKHWDVPLDALTVEECADAIVSALR